MSRAQSPAAHAAALRVIAGEAKATVSRETGVARATIDRHLARLGHPTKPKRYRLAPDLIVNPQK